MKKVIAMGELLIDFIPKQKGVSLLEVSEFIKMPGGAPANVVVTVAKLGGKSSFIGQVGRDVFGDYLINTLNEANVDTTNLYQTNHAKTALAFVSLTKEGERDFIFYRDPSADQLFSPSQMDHVSFDNAIFHFCSVSLSNYPIKAAHLYAIQSMKKFNGFISFDPNIRLALWNDHKAYQKVIKEFIPYANLLKISDDELEFITGLKDSKQAIDELFIGDVSYIILTKGAYGVELYTKSKNYKVPGFKVNVKDTTGAGDALIGAFLYQLSKDELTPANEDEKLVEYLRFANATAALTTTKLGAMDAIPSIEEIEELLK
ncbi:MAG: carbohydrate kinase [Bacillota bacterium]